MWELIKIFEDQLGPIMTKKRSSYKLHPLALTVKITPKCPKMALKGPQWYHVVIVWPIAPDFWSFKQFLIA